MTQRYPMAHKINTRHPYTPRESSDIRVTFARLAQEAETAKAAKAARKAAKSAPTPKLRKVK